MQEEIKDWWSQAQEDLKTAEFLAENKRYRFAAFLYQQAIEKALKALLIKKGLGLVKSHDCFFLAKQCNAPESISKKADFLTPYYFRTRYPDTQQIEIGNKEIKHLSTEAKEVLLWIKKSLEQ